MTLFFSKLTGRVFLSIIITIADFPTVRLLQCQRFHVLVTLEPCSTAPSLAVLQLRENSQVLPQSLLRRKRTVLVTLFQVFQVLGFTEFNCSSCVTTNPSLLAFASQKNPLASTMPVLSDSPAPKEDVPRKP